MEVKLEKQYPLDVPMEDAWTLLSDLEATAACMPGAEITERVGDNSYKGAVNVKVGPAAAKFGGTVDVVELVAAERKVVMRGKGADKGGSSASMDLTAVITPSEDNPQHCVLNGNAAVIVNGKFAQFGGRMMVQVSEMILAQFVENFRQTAQANSQPATGVAGDSAEGSQAGSAASAPSVAKEINGLALVWGLIKSWFSGLFGRRNA